MSVSIVGGNAAGAQRRADLVAIAAHHRDGEFEGAALVGGDAFDDEGRHAGGKAEQFIETQVKFEDGRVATRTWEDYPILRFSDIPGIDIELIDNPNEPTLGLGEASVGPTGAAIGNALARALGKRVRDLPLTREKIMATLLAD